MAVIGVYTREIQIARTKRFADIELLAISLANLTMHLVADARA